jgi:hypothetical protein
MEGDIDHNGSVELLDAILGLQVCAGISPSKTVHMGADVDYDSRLGTEVVVYILQAISGLR